FLEAAVGDEESGQLTDRLLLPRDRAGALAELAQLLPEGFGVAERPIDVLIPVGGDGERVHDRARALPAAGTGDEFVGFCPRARAPRLEGAGEVVLVAAGASDGDRLRIVAEPTPGADRLARDRLDRIDQEFQPRPGTVVAIAGQGKAALDQRAPDAD